MLVLSFALLAWSETELRCELTGEGAEIHEANAAVATRHPLPHGREQRSVSMALVQDGALWFLAPPGLISATVRVEGYLEAPLDVDLERGLCTVGPLRPAPRIEGWVLPAVPGTTVHGCGSVEIAVDADGRFSGTAPYSDGRCLLRATRTDDGTSAWSAPVEVDLQHLVEVRLELPPHPIAGIGARVMPRAGEAPRVWAVTAGGPAYRAGLRCGDRLLAVDGEDVRDMRHELLTAALTGAAGSEVQLELEGGRSVALAREPAEAPDPSDLCPD